MSIRVISAFDVNLACVYLTVRFDELFQCTVLEMICFLPFSRLNKTNKGPGKARTVLYMYVYIVCSARAFVPRHPAYNAHSVFSFNVVLMQVSSVMWVRKFTEILSSKIRRSQNE